MLLQPLNAALSIISSELSEIPPLPLYEPRYALYKPEQLENAYERDIRLGYTTVGPHRDDIRIFLDGAEAKGFASQGQTRTAALSLKLAEVEIFKRLSGEAPVLILDDVMSELDLPRRKKLAGRTGGLQTILTCTHAERVLYGRTVNKIRIEGGKIKS